MSLYQLWGQWNPLDECLAWIREKGPSGRGQGAGGGGELGGTSTVPATRETEDAGSSAGGQPAVYRRLNKAAKPRTGRTFNPVIGRPIQLPTLTPNARKDDIAKVLQTLQLIRARSGGRNADGGSHSHVPYAHFPE